MTPFEVRKGLRKLDFSASGAGPSDASTHVTVEFEVGKQLAEGQLASINLGLRQGVARELKGRPVLISAANARQSTYVYRLEGDVA